VVVEVGQIRSTQSALSHVAEEAAAAYDLPVTPELHSNALFHGEREFEGVAPRARVSVYAKALDALVAADPLVVIRGVRRPAIRFLNPHRLAWRYAIESIDEYGRGGPILVVADEHAETEVALRGDIRTYIDYGTGGWKPRRIGNVLPELKFLDSRSNALLQGADLVAFIHQRRSNFATERDERSQRAREMLWQKRESPAPSLA
jgi:hypothetical protein